MQNRSQRHAGNHRSHQQRTEGAVIHGGAGDELRGGKGADTIYAGAGNDFVSGGKRSDIIVGGDGDECSVVTAPPTRFQEAMVTTS